MPFYAGTNHILQPNPILCIPDFRQSTNPQISVKAQPHADLLSTSFRFRAFSQFTWHGNRHSTGLQGTSARAMVCRNSADLPRTALRARSHTFLQFTLHPNRLSTGLQGISLTRWHRFVSIERPEPLWTALQGISARAMVCRRKNSFAKPSEPNTRSTAEKSGATSD